MAQEWNLIAIAIARQTGRRIGLDVSTQMAMNTVFAPDREPAERKPRPQSELAPLDAKPQPYRIQFGRRCARLWTVDFGRSRDSGVGRCQLQSSRLQASRFRPKPKTVALRILDREGQEIFERRKADRPITERPA
jgi:hypothetical protein